MTPEVEILTARVAEIEQRVEANEVVLAALAGEADDVPTGVLEQAHRAFVARLRGRRE